MAYVVPALLLAQEGVLVLSVGHRLHHQLCARRPFFTAVH